MAGKDGPPFSIDVANPERRLAGIDPCPIQVELEFGFVGLARDDAGSLGSEARLAHTEDGLPVAAELPFDGGNTGRPKRCIPIGIDPLEILYGIDLHKAIKLEVMIAWLAWGACRLLAGGSNALHLLGAHRILFLPRLKSTIEVGDHAFETLDPLLVRFAFAHGILSQSCLPSKTCRGKQERGHEDETIWHCGPQV